MELSTKLTKIIITWIRNHVIEQNHKIEQCSLCIKGKSKAEPERNLILIFKKKFEIKRIRKEILVAFRSANDNTGFRLEHKPIVLLMKNCKHLLLKNGIQSIVETQSCFSAF